MNLNKINISIRDDVTGKSAKDYIEEGKIIPLYKSLKNYDSTDPTPSTIESSQKISDKDATPIATSKKIASEETSFKVIEKANIELFTKAFIRIADATSLNLEMVERSNYFDDWKDLLDQINCEWGGLSVHHNKIIGAILIATRQKDISDFDHNTLLTFRDATNVVRKPRINKKDAQDILAEFLKQNLNITIPLSTENLSELDIHKNELMINQLLKNHQ